MSSPKSVTFVTVSASLDVRELHQVENAIHKVIQRLDVVISQPRVVFIVSRVPHQHSLAHAASLRIDIYMHAPILT